MIRINLESIVDALEDIAIDLDEGETPSSDPILLQRLLDACHEIHDNYLRNKLEAIIEDLEN
tara:strand:- start:448 stop:633 length:186 start_codon:yes stop_codon:yes gene_type:complete